MTSSAQFFHKNPLYDHSGFFLSPRGRKLPINDTALSEVPKVISLLPSSLWNILKKTSHQQSMQSSNAGQINWEVWEQILVWKVCGREVIQRLFVLLQEAQDGGHQHLTGSSKKFVGSAQRSYLCKISG